MFAVILAHGVPYYSFQHFLAPGFWGVDLFFVLSGFLITEALLKQIQANEKPAHVLRSFYLKRSLRIFPLYYLVLALALALNLDDCRHYVGYVLTYTLNIYNAVSGSEGRYLSHLWSLCVEEQFYLVWPFLLLLIKPKHHKHLIFSLVMAAVLFRWVMAVHHYRNYHLYNYRFALSSFDALGIGAVLAYVKLYHGGLLKKSLRNRWVPLVFFVLFLLLSVFDYPYKDLLAETFLRLCVSVCCFYIIGYGIFGYKGRFGRFLERPAVQYLGKISYGIYLFHMFVQYFFDDYVDKYVFAHFPAFLPRVVQYNLHLLLLPVITVLTVVLAAVSFSYFEKPFLRLKAQLTFNPSPTR